MERNTTTSFPEPRAALATTKDTVALSVLSFEIVQLTTNFPAMGSTLLSTDVIDRMVHVGERVAGHAAPGGQVGRSAGIAGGQLQDRAGLQRLHPEAQLQHEVAAAHAAGVPFDVRRRSGGGRSRDVRHRSGAA